MVEVMWVTAGYPWERDPVGSSFIRTQAQALTRLGASVTVVAPVPIVPWPLARFRAHWQAYSETPRLARDGSILVSRPRYFNVPGEPSWARPDRFVAGAVWRERQDWAAARAIHGHYAITGLAAWRLARRTGLPFFLTFHGDDMNTWPDERPDRRRDLRAAVSEARTVYAVSAALAQRVREVTGVDAVALPLGSDHAWIDRASLAKADARKLSGVPEDQLMVLFVGYLVREKGVRELVDAIIELGAPYVAVLAGEGPERGYGSDDPRGEERLRYVGTQSHENVIRLMSAADVLVLASHGEGLPTVLVEAGSIGLPIIASDVGGIPELLGEDRGTILPDVSAGTIMEALRSLAARRPEATAAAQRLRDHVRAEYDVISNARYILADYQSAGSPDSAR